MTLTEYNTQRPKVLCEKCNGYYTNANIERHKQACNGIIKTPFVPKYVDLDITTLECGFCKKLCKNYNSLVQHEIRCKYNPNRRDWDKLGRYSTLNRKGQTKDTNDNIALVTSKLVEGYASGKIRKDKFPVNVVSIYKEHNDSEIQKWINYCQSIDIYIPEHRINKNSNGYITVSNIIEKDFIDTYGRIRHEHNLVMTAVLGRKLNGLSVHHINKVRHDNVPINLIAFETKRQHLQFHQSQFAYLIYDEEKKIFHTEIRKIDIK